MLCETCQAALRSVGPEQRQTEVEIQSNPVGALLLVLLASQSTQEHKQNLLMYIDLVYTFDVQSTIVTAASAHPRLCKVSILVSIQLLSQC